MERTLRYRIPESMKGHKLSEFLHLQGFSHQNLVELKKMKESVILDGRWEYLSHRLEGGEALEIFIRETEVSEKIPPVDLPFPIVYEDEDLVVVNKPSGMPIHPSMKNYENTLGNAAAYYFAKQGKAFLYRCVNRLDKDTTGLTILAKHMLSSSVLYEEMTKREIHREYTAIVEDEPGGAPLPDCHEEPLPDCHEEPLSYRYEQPGSFPLAEQGVIDMPLGRKEDSAVERVVDFQQGDRAVTHFRVLRRFTVQQEDGCLQKLALLRLHLDTGRTHQIRVHMQSIGHPLIGDFLYNPENHVMARQALHAGTLSFVHPVTGEALTFEAPLPEDMQKVLHSAVDKEDA